MKSEWQNFLSHFQTHTHQPGSSSIMDLSYLGLLKVSGQKAKELLQGQLTCDLNEISPTQTKLGAHCNPQGRIISLFRIFQHQDSYYLQMPKSLVAIAITALKKYAVFFKVDLSDASDDWIILGYHFDNGAPLITSLPEKTDAALYTHDLYCIKCSDHRYEFIGKFQSIKELCEKLKPTTARQSEIQWKDADIKNGHATIYPETTEKFLPHELYLHEKNAISFSKGCYTGQEIIARMQYRGKLKNSLHTALLKIKTTPIRGSDIYDEKGIAGKLIDYSKLESNDYYLLITTNDASHALFLDAHQTIKITITG